MNSIKKETDCNKMMENKYKFYIAFENSICDDYVTEKYFRTLSYDVIPIVLGGADYNAVGPPGAFINALDYANAGELVEHMRRIDADDAKFAEHFWWRDFYEIRYGWVHRAQQHCRICEMLHDPDTTPKVYSNMYQWWFVDSHCRAVGEEQCQ